MGPSQLWLVVTGEGVAADCVVSEDDDCVALADCVAAAVDDAVVLVVLDWCDPLVTANRPMNRAVLPVAMARRMRAVRRRRAATLGETGAVGMDRGSPPVLSQAC